MTKVMIASVYDAFRPANVPDDKARSAAEDIAGYENRISSVERKLDVTDAKIDGLEKRMNWQFGILAAMVGAHLVRAFAL